MTIRLKPELQRFIQEQVSSGHFATPEDVIEAGLGRLREDDLSDLQPGEMNGLIDKAEAQFARGEGHSLEEVRRRFHDRSAGAGSAGHTE